MGRNEENTTGFVTSGFITKKGTPSGEGAMFNKLPPGDDIDNQEVAEISKGMPMKKITPLGYGDGFKE